MSDLNLIKPEKVQNIINKFCYTIGMIPTSYKVSLTYEEQIIAIGHYLEETVIPALNNNAEAVAELQSLFVQLKDYVENYFTNLDVQEEINNKLDKMAVDGTLQEIITAYLQVNGILAFNTVTAMKETVNLLEGSFAETYGFYAENDEGGAKYKIRALEENETTDEITVISLQNNLVAELIITNEMNIKQFGAKGDGVQDDTTYIQKAIDNVKKLFIPSTANYYKVTDNLSLNSNQTIFGVGETSKILMPNNLLKTIFEIKNVNNIVLDNIKLCNESCQTGSSPDTTKNKLIYSENVENLTIQNCLFEYAYSRGILIMKTKNLSYLNNIFKNATYDMLTLLQETENIMVDNSVFDTIVSSSENSYLFATGKIDNEVYNFSCRNITVRNSKFLNNPKWEGIETHSCNGFIVENNYVENCKVGISAYYGSTSPVCVDGVTMKDIIIKGNTLKCSKQDTNRYGIIVGSNPDVLRNLGENIYISDNILYEFSDANNVGAIYIRGVKNFEVLNNKILNSLGCGICTRLCYQGSIKNNKILESVYYGIRVIAGTWLVDIVNNTIKNLIKDNLTDAISGSGVCLLNIENNDIQGATRLFNVAGTVMTGNITSSSRQIGKKGNYVKNEYGFITHYCTDTVIRPALTETLSNLSLSGSSDTKIVNGTNALQYLCIGEEITIPRCWVRWRRFNNYYY